MQPLNAMDNVQEARLFHALMLTEIPEFIKFTRLNCLYIANHADAITACGENHLLTPAFWIELSRDVHLKIEQFGRKLELSSVVFAEQLFGGYRAVFMVPQLVRYAATLDDKGLKFKQAVDLFFT